MPSKRAATPVTVLFVDIRDFTGFTDQATARGAVAFLNEFFGVVVPLLEARGGHANKFLGDGVLGVFGAPEPCRTTPTALWRRPPTSPRRSSAPSVNRCRIGIGVNSGLVLVGSVGAGATWELGIIGDPVNVAARVERATRDLGEPVLVTEATLPSRSLGRSPRAARSDRAEGQAGARARLRPRDGGEDVSAHATSRLALIAAEHGAATS